MPSALFSLPRELRDEIYTHCIDYPQISTLVNAYQEEARLLISARYPENLSIEALEKMLQWTSMRSPQRPTLQTPPILLLSRQITAEVLNILHKKTLCLDVPISSNFRRDVRGLLITDLVSEASLREVRYARLDLGFETLETANCWHRTVQYLWDIWKEGSKLKGLTVHMQPARRLEIDHEKAIVRRWVINRVSLW